MKVVIQLEESLFRAAQALHYVGLHFPSKLFLDSHLDSHLSFTSCYLVETVDPPLVPIMPPIIQMFEFKSVLFFNTN